MTKSLCLSEKRQTEQQNQRDREEVLSDETRLMQYVPLCVCALPSTSVKYSHSESSLRWWGPVDTKACYCTRNIYMNMVTPNDPYYQKGHETQSSCERAVLHTAVVEEVFRCFTSEKVVTLQCKNTLLQAKVLHSKSYLEQLCGTFHFVLILAVPVDKSGSVSPNIRSHVPSISVRRKETTWPGGEPFS